MAVSEQRVRVAECDGCGTKRYGEGTAKIPGMHGSVTVIADDGSEHKAEFFSCKTDAKHVGLAAVGAFTGAESARAANGYTGARPSSYGG